MMELCHSFKVRTYCATFNHENYIIDALKGFSMQQTTFPVVYTIVDDASTDRTAAVIKQFVGENFNLGDTSVGYDKDTDYGHVTFARHKTNENCYFAVIYLKENHYSQKKSKNPYLTEWMDTKYIAMCEGDDYWTDPLKLQKQVSFMDAHEEYSMCFHGADVLDDVNEECQYSSLKEGDYTARDIYDSWLVPTCSVVYSRTEKPFESNPAIVYGDIFLYLQLAERGKIHCMGTIGSVYRRHSGGLSYEEDGKKMMALAKQYRWLAKRFPQEELRGISLRKENEYLKGVLYDEDLNGVWKCRLRYAWLHPHLLFSRFMLQTIKYLKQ